MSKLDRRPRRVRHAAKLFAMIVSAALLSACADSADEDNMGANPGSAMDSTPAGTPAPPSPAVIEDDQERTVSAQLNEWAIDLSRESAPAGEITFTAMNTGTMEHAFEVEGQGIEEETEPIAPGESASLTVTLGPGTYTIYCPVTGDYDHRQQGMETTLVVQ